MVAPLKFLALFSPLLLFVVFFIGNTNGITVRRSQVLAEDLYNVSWTADLDAGNITFKVVAKTLGYVGFGISPQGGMVHADVVIGGVNGSQTYFTDRYATGKFEPKIDEKQNWHLISATEESGYTTLEFWRELDTCDEEDIAITSDTTKFIYSIGASDVIEKHAKSGAASVNILDPDAPKFDTSLFDGWNITVNTTLPPGDTFYWCTAHKTPPEFSFRRQIVGFKVMLNNEDSIEHNHHMILHHCIKDDSLVPIYEKYLNHPGGECYEEDGMSEMYTHCKTYMYVWAKGGDPLFLPEHVGLPINEDGKPEYFLLEIHYDNPKLKPEVQYETGLEIYTTIEKRDTDAGLLMIGHDVTFTLLIPPNTTDYVISGHCSGPCTEKHVPEEGLNVFNVLLHSHLAGRKIKLRQFRDDVELPWMAYDNQYDFNYQQNRPLTEIRKLQRGDHLTLECTDDSSYLEKPAAVLGGLSTRHEMCETFLLYWPRIPTLDVCGSSFVDLPYLFQQFGIEAFDEKSADPSDPTISAPERLRNKTYSDVVSNHVNWTTAMKEELQQKSRYDPHLAFCMSRTETAQTHLKQFRSIARAKPRDEEFEYVSYPKNVKAYEPPEGKCRDSSSLALLQLTTFSSMGLLLVFVAVCRYI